MTRVVATLLVAATVVAAGSGAERQRWRHADRGLLPATYVLSLAIDQRRPETMYAGTIWRGIAKSVDGGAHWRPTGPFPLLAAGAVPRPPDVMSLAVAAETIYAGTNFGGVLKSVDGGASWRLANRGLPSVPYLRARVFEPIVALLLDRRRPGTVYAAMAATGVFVSRDGAAHWRRLAPGLAEPRVESLALVGGTLYAATGGGVFKSTGGAWRRAGLRGRWLEAIATDSRRPSTVYAGALHGGVYASRDGGESWNPANDGLRNLYVRTLLADPRTPGRIYAGTYGGVFTSGNGGRTWSELNDGLANRLVQALAIGSGRSASLYAGTLGGGVFAIEQRRSR